MPSLIRKYVPSGVWVIACEVLYVTIWRFPKLTSTAHGPFEREGTTVLKKAVCLGNGIFSASKLFT